MATKTKFFHSVMTGAPVLSGTAGSLITLLDALLVNGYGTTNVTSIVVAGGIVLAVVLSKRGKKGRSRHGDHASDRGPLPPVNPYPPQVSGANNGMVPPPAAGQYAPQQQAPYQAAFPQQAPHPAAPYPVPPQQAAQPPVMPGNTQNPYADNNR